MLRDDVLDEIKENIEGMTQDEARYWVENDAVCEAGSVSGLIYYHDTKAVLRPDEGRRPRPDRRT